MQISPGFPHASPHTAPCRNQDEISPPDLLLHPGAGQGPAC
ncbi:hypothetical protein AmDm5_1924 [Acetobacter malorum]|nr:hypothetical protein AmDm5_1924 [Acetobacter malorum]